ncbi:MAG TPA: GTPase HflX [Polyangia bacterium]|jgi:GTP-binding protein HflX|nr:GTPase HflX [Polyangia bacterium]
MVIVGVRLQGVDEIEFESSLQELERLGKTLGLEPVGRVVQKRDRLAPAAVLGEGKLKELAALTGGTGVVPSGVPEHRRRPSPDEDEADAQAEASGEEETAGAEDTPDSESEAGPEPEKARQASVVLVDHDLTPSQARNLERATSAEVYDRTSVILAIFQRHARTREAKMQIEIARLAYMAPRLREAGAGQDRQRGGIGGKGAGESSLELERRRIRDRIAELRAELEQIRQESDVRRSRRSEQPTVALVGYTNAGKSSWMRVLTGGEVYVADKLFATLDTTVRALHPESRPRILVSDTVGFIKKLPHDLVASFRSTLEEAKEASLLIHVVDAADPAFRAQLAVTRGVLHEIGADDSPSLLLLNKIDLVAPEARQALAVEFPDALAVSSRDPADVARVHARIVAFFERDMIEEELFVPYARQAIVARAYETMRVLDERYEEEGTRFRVRGPAAAIEKLRTALG